MIFDKDLYDFCFITPRGLRNKGATKNINKVVYAQIDLLKPYIDTSASRKFPECILDIEIPECVVEKLLILGGMVDHSVSGGDTALEQYRKGVLNVKKEDIQRATKNIRSVDRRRKKYETYEENDHVDEFYRSEEWKEIRDIIISIYGTRCMCCSKTKEDHNIVINIDHIRNFKRYKSLRTKLTNLQVLCSGCNYTKNGSYRDYRSSADFAKFDQWSNEESNRSKYGRYL